MCACVCVYVRVCVRACVRVRVHMCIIACVHVFVCILYSNCYIYTMQALLAIFFKNWHTLSIFGMQSQISCVIKIRARV